MQKTIFSGIQPSGNLHLGNYLGAIHNWTTMQNDYNSIFCVVDLHAITVPRHPEQLKRKVIEVAKIYLAIGIDPKQSTIFVQSQVPQHMELMWILGTITKTGELYKMTQFKDKTGALNAKNEQISVDAGLLNYPILMAADILLHDTDIVPVGEDQLQHIELARTLARRFNDRFGKTFKVPEPYVKKKGMRIMSLDDPTKKMSKSASSKYSQLGLLDSPDEIHEKVKKAVTDSGNSIQYSDDQPAIKNLLDIFSLLSGTQPTEIAKKFENTGYGKFKEELARTIVEFLAPFQEKYHAISDTEVLTHLRKGKEKLIPLVNKKMKEIKKKIGLVAE